MEADKDPYSLRKNPRQKRSQMLVESILTAATRVLPKAPAERISTNEVAEIAGVSIGSLYQYFPNRDSILAKLIERDLEESERLFRERTQPIRHLALEEKIPVVIDIGYGIFMRHRRLKRNLFEHAARLKRSRQVMLTWNAIAGVLEELIHDHDDELDLEDPKRSVWLLSHAAQGLLMTVILTDPPLYTDGEVKAELVRLARGYLGLPPLP